jgi:hypothetical protein
MTRLAAIVLMCASLLLPASSFAGGKRDPLTEAEVDQLREATQEPNKRIKLIVKFAKARMLAIDQLRSDPKLADTRGKQIHDLLEDFDFIADELDRNLDMFSRQKNDLRKALKEAIEAYTDWQLKLRSLQHADTTNPKALAELREYEFILESATETVNAGLDTARELLDAHNQSAEASKRKK